MTAADARSKATQAKPSVASAASGPPETFFALYTSKGEGQIQADGSVKATHVNQPVWVVAYPGVMASSAGPGPGFQSKVTDYFIFDDATGNSVGEALDG